MVDAEVDLIQAQFDEQDQKIANLTEKLSQFQGQTDVYQSQYMQQQTLKQRSQDELRKVTQDQHDIETMLRQQSYQNESMRRDTANKVDRMQTLNKELIKHGEELKAQICVLEARIKEVTEHKETQLEDIQQKIQAQILIKQQLDKEAREETQLIIKKFHVEE